ncbi:hypothetical protein FACS189413_13070 [Bacteroidia bacterium]|nr:hypothetical protein FACS189463_1900 [Bacteroidia bacterium]GHU71407.1 hypothetical protein FACS189413_13070 [Bacteroidia bacterium]
MSTVEKYIEEQKEHHKKIAFKEEYVQFLKEYGNPNTTQIIQNQIFLINYAGQRTNHPVIPRNILF